MTIAADTNVLLRALVEDEAAPQQCASARELFASAAKVRICGAVFLETLWTLERSYGFGRPEVARTAARILSHPCCDVQDQELLLRAVQRYAALNIDFADAIAVEDAADRGVTLRTFDRKLAKVPGAELLT
ncbi:MAG: type II toxin-antitoxin system VapC family toxin [Acidobacteria bacterium]|nr:type II toxin-antitoxin system VapC family toxin [Acidobacteriota bacterium]